MSTPNVPRALYAETLAYSSDDSDVENNYPQDPPQPNLYHKPPLTVKEEDFGAPRAEREGRMPPSLTLQRRIDGMRFELSPFRPIP